MGKRIQLTLVVVLIVCLSGCGGSSAAQVQDNGAYSQTTFTYPSEGEDIAADLWLPAGSGPHPAVVMGHGSGRSRKEYGNAMAEHFVKLGYAVLTHDKRGVGGSGGDYVQRSNASTENLTLLAKDIAAGIEYLKKRPDIDARQIGLWGWSQAGWILPIVTSLQDNIKFVILCSGPTVTVGEENTYSALTGDRSIDTGLTQEEMSAKLRERGAYGFDPMPFLEQMDMPALWLLGEADESIPIPETVAHLDRLIKTGKPFQYKLYPNANHGLRVDGVRVEDFWQVQDQFLKEVVGIKLADSK